MTDRCVSCGEDDARHKGRCHTCAARQLWESLPAEVQAEVDQQIRQERRVWAIHSVFDREPHLKVAWTMVELRCQALGLMPGSPSE